MIDSLVKWSDSKNRKYGKELRSKPSGKTKYEEWKNAQEEEEGANRTEIKR